jgi:peptidoglycan/LPS O-acetylase OafA/YrhL
MAPTRYRADIDGLRAIAVVAVVLFHAFPERIPGGFVGVDIFFVISGFLITGILVDEARRSEFSILGFYQRRINRIFPALLIVIAGVLCAGMILLLNDEMRLAAKHAVASLLFVQNGVLLTESGYFDAASYSKPFLHFWSLAVEEQFYIIWPLLILMSFRAKERFLPFAIAVTVLSLGACVYLTQVAPSYAYFLPFTRFWELAIGGIVAYLCAKGNKLSARFRNPVAILAVVFIAASIALINKQIGFPGWIALVPVLATAALIWAGPDSFVAARVLSLPPVVYVGLISYPVYLWHWPLLSFEQLLNTEYPSKYMRSLLVLASFALAALTYHLVERRVKASRNKERSALALLGTGAALACISLFMFSSDSVGRKLYAPNVMTEAQIDAERSKHWNTPNDTGYAAAATKVILFGDSQAFDIYTALRNGNKLGLRLFRSPHDCKEFFAPVLRTAYNKRECERAFQEFIESPELSEAKYLIYSHLWSMDETNMDNYRRAFQEIYKRNPSIKPLIFGYKPLLGKKWTSIRQILRKAEPGEPVDGFLKKIAWVPEGNAVAKRVAAEFQLPFVDTAEIYCRTDCTFFNGNEYMYFDQNHWSEGGKAAFFRKLEESGFVEDLRRDRPSFSSR